MNNNEFRCNCVEMTRAIKNKIDMEIANMSPVEVAEYLQNRRESLLSNINKNNIHNEISFGKAKGKEQW